MSNIQLYCSIRKDSGNVGCQEATENYLKIQESRKNQFSKIIVMKNLVES